MQIGFIGPGKVGCSLGTYLCQHGHKVIGYYGWHEASAKEAALLTKTAYYTSLSSIVSDSDMIFLTVPDGSIASVWEEISVFDLQKKYICHCSGAVSSEIFSGIKQKKAYGFSVHPLLAVSNKECASELARCVFTIEGDAEHIDVIRQLFEDCENTVSQIAAKDKLRYHAAAVLSSNLVIGLLDAAAGLLEESGFSKEAAGNAFAPLAEGNLQKFFSVGSQEALTGPIERNDIGTVQKHLEALDADTKDIYKAVSLRVLSVAKQKHPQTDYRHMEQVLKGV